MYLSSRSTAAFLAAVLVSLASPLVAEQPFHDRKHHSDVFDADRTYRLFLPPGYDDADDHYPVIYYFHGHSDRYTLSAYDDGEDTVPKILDFVRHNDVIVVGVDGYVAEDYQGFYGGSPWDVRKEGGRYDFGRYFLELVEHIDSSYRTLTSRRYRATSGLSMGGFMSLYLSSRYPEWIGSASSFNPGPEFFTGDPGRRVLWRPKDHVPSHRQTPVRLIRASGDYISQYHEETRAAYSRDHRVDFEFRQDEYHRHWATSIGETFAFHERAFATANLDNPPEEFSHANAYSAFSVWGYDVETDSAEPGYIYLDDVRQGSLRVRTRRWAPDGPAVPGQRITIATAPLYRAGADYQLLDHNLATGKTSRSALQADKDGRLHVTIDGAGHQLSFVGPGTDAMPPVLLPASLRGRPIVQPGAAEPLPVSIYNPRGEPLEDVTVELATLFPTAKLTSESVTIPSIPPGESVDLSDRLAAKFTAGDGYFAPVRFDATVTFDGWHQDSRFFYVDMAPEVMPQPAEIEILDGRTLTFDVFHQQGNQGGGWNIERTVTEGSGDGDGKLEPGEEATIWVRIRQGLDPFDKNTWHRAKVHSDSPWIDEVGDIQELKEREWTGAQHRSSLVRLADDAPRDAQPGLILECETWSFVATPDLRFGPEVHYQPIQRHRPHLFQLKLPR